MVSVQHTTSTTTALNISAKHTQNKVSVGDRSQVGWQHHARAFSSPRTHTRLQKSLTARVLSSILPRFVLATFRTPLLPPPFHSTTPTALLLAPLVWSEEIESQPIVREEELPAPPSSGEYRSALSILLP